jgi:prophage tail gpP-like protein
MSNNITLIVGGQQCSQWDDISIDSDLLIPADAWSVTLFNPPADPLPSTVFKGAVVEITYNGQTILKGTIDRITDSVNRQGYRLSVSGRDVVGVLLDSSVPVIVRQQITLSDIVGQYILTDLGELIHDIAIDQGVDYTSTKVAVEPSESIWDAIVKAAESAGQFVWADATGAIRIGNPFNKRQPKTPNLIMRRAGQNNNVLSVEYAEDITSQYSTVIVLGQDNSTQASFYATEDNLPDTYTGQDLTPSKKDQPDAPEYTGKSTQKLPYLRRKIVLDSLADNDDQAVKRARKIMQDGNLSAYSLNVEVDGWTCATGQIWTTGWTVNYQSDVTRKVANGTWVIMGRTLKLGRNGKTTQLRLKRKQYWMQPVAPLPPDNQDDAEELTEYPDS